MRNYLLNRRRAADMKCEERLQYMSRDRLVSQPGLEEIAAGVLEAACRAEYVEPAPLADILHEQIDYLVAHASTACAPGCADCTRLQQVQGWLLLPFRGSRKVRGSRRAA